MDDDAGALLPVGLREAVETWLTQRGRTFSWGDDPATLNVGDARLHLGALTREWALLDADARPAWLDTALGTMLDGALREVVDRVTADFSQAAPRLRPKLWPQGALGAAARGELKIELRYLARGLAVGLALQFDGAVVSPTRDDVARWPEPVDALMERAWSNLAERCAVEPERLDDPNGEVWGLFEGDYFIASHLFRLPSVLSTEAPHGFLAAAPHSGAVVAHPLGAPALASVANIAGFVQRGFTKAPRPLSDALYWARAGSVEAISLVRRDDQRMLDGSPTFVDTASQLGWPCVPVGSIARSSFDACAALRDSSNDRLVQLVAADGGPSLPFDPELERDAEAYWILSRDDGRYVDAHDEMVFDSAEELVHALFVDSVSSRAL